jgi:hypothetical protein
MRAAWTASVLAAALVGTTLPAPARAQVDTAATLGDTAPSPRAVPAAVRWGKWAAAAAAVGLTIEGIERHNAANAAFGDLVGYCGGTTCTLGSDGRYDDPGAEALYQRVVRSDRAARVWIVTGQLAAVGSAVLFVMDLIRPHEEPNIPYSGLLLQSGNGVTRVGLRIPVRIEVGER